MFDSLADRIHHDETGRGHYHPACHSHLNGLRGRHCPFRRPVPRRANARGLDLYSGAIRRITALTIWPYPAVEL